MNQTLLENEDNIKSNVKEVLKILEDEIDDDEEFEIDNLEQDLSIKGNDQ